MADDKKPGGPLAQALGKPPAQAPATGHHVPAGTSFPPSLRETGNRAPETGTAPLGPLAEALRKGADIGTPEKAPQPKDGAAAAEPLKGIKNDEKMASINAVLLKGLEAKGREARISAIRMVGNLGGPEMAGRLAMASCFLVAKQTGDDPIDGEVVEEVKSALTSLLRRHGAAAIPHIMQDAMVDSKSVISGISVYGHLNSVAVAIGEANLEAGAEALAKVIELAAGWSATEMYALEALAKITGVKSG